MHKVHNEHTHTQILPDKNTQSHTYLTNDTRIEMLSWTHFKSVVILDDVKIHWTGKLFMNLVITGKVTISI